MKIYAVSSGEVEATVFYKHAFIMILSHLPSDVQ